MWPAHRFVRRGCCRGLVEGAGGLKAPLGVHAILGNHDWWEDGAAQANGHGPTIAGMALERAGIPVYENDAVRLTKAGEHSGSPASATSSRFSSRVAAIPVCSDRRRRSRRARCARCRTASPSSCSAHEPDIMPRVPERVSLVMSGHTHGGQVRLFGWSPVVPSRYGNRYAYGHVREQCDLIVSGGLGCSILPVRFGMPPEIVDWCRSTRADGVTAEQRASGNGRRRHLSKAAVIAAGCAFASPPISTA